MKVADVEAGPEPAACNEMLKEQLDRKTGY